MKVYVGEDYKGMSRKAANIILAQVILKPDSVLGHCYIILIYVLCLKSNIYIFILQMIKDIHCHPRYYQIFLMRENLTQNRI